MECRTYYRSFPLLFLSTIHQLSACTRCSFFRFFTSVKAKPVKQERSIKAREIGIKRIKRNAL